MAVYFAKIVGYDLVRIGTSRVVKNRRGTLQSWCPFDLEIVATTPGSYLVESWFLHRHRADRTRNDWHVLTPAIAVDMATLGAGVVVLGCPDERDYRPVRYGSNLPAILERLGMSLRDMAKACGVKHSAITSWSTYGMPVRHFWSAIEAAAERGVIIGPRDFYLSERRPTELLTREQIVKLRLTSERRAATRAANLALKAAA